MVKESNYTIMENTFRGLTRMDKKMDTVNFTGLMGMFSRVCTLKTYKMDKENLYVLVAIDSRVTTKEVEEMGMVKIMNLMGMFSKEIGRIT